jgi:hypothetical protein
LPIKDAEGKYIINILSQPIWLYFEIPDVTKTVFLPETISLIKKKPL